jgi:hypothetical protein
MPARQARQGHTRLSNYMHGWVMHAANIPRQQLVTGCDVWVRHLPPHQHQHGKVQLLIDSASHDQQEEASGEPQITMTTTGSALVPLSATALPQDMQRNDSAAWDQLIPCQARRAVPRARHCRGNLLDTAALAPPQHHHYHVHQTCIIDHYHHHTISAARENGCRRVLSRHPTRPG